MTQPRDFGARLSRAETDAAAARHLSAAHDRHLSDLGVKVDANRKAISALAEQTRAQFDRVNARFDQVDARFDRLETYMHARFTEMDRGFAEMRHGFDQTAAGFARIAELIAARGDDR